MQKIEKAGIIAAGADNHLLGVKFSHVQTAAGLEKYGIAGEYHPIGWKTAGSVEGITTPLSKKVIATAERTGLPVILFLTGEAGAAGGLMALQEPDLPVERLVLISARVNPIGATLEDLISPRVSEQTVVRFHRLLEDTPAGVRERFVPVRPKEGDDTVSEEASAIPGVTTIFYDDVVVGHHAGIGSILSDPYWLAHVGIHGEPPPTRP